MGSVPLRRASSLADSFARLDGSHRFKEANPGAFVEYSARRRPGGRVFYFNFDLAREMGLIPESHRNVLSEELSEAILEAFSLVIINEWDLENGVRFRHRDIKPGKYMATRYLQLQHPSRVGKTSGDGRGIWNGEITHRGATWDVMSSGTGATKLSPATAIEGRYFKSGDPKVCYGNGYNSIDDGLSAALMSEIFHREGISTERTLALIVFPGGSSINVRAGRNLLRPSHLFGHLKQANLEALKNAVNYCIERERVNGALDIPRDWGRRPEAALKAFCSRAARDFARSSARYESDYVFCWMDWDGDNILVDGGIIDYGSIRRFGGYHAGYRYDDGDRYSTRLGEQRGRARYIVQTFAQIQEFILSGHKRPIAEFQRHALVRLFDECFEAESKRRLLWKSGLSQQQVERWMSAPRHQARLVTRYLRAFQRLERLQCARGPRRVADGETTDAVFVMSRFLRDYPALFEKAGGRAGASVLAEACRSKFAGKRDLERNRAGPGIWEALEDAYAAIARETARLVGGSLQKMMREWRMRASSRLPDPPVTGDGILGVMEVLLKLPRQEAQAEIERFLARFDTGKGPRRGDRSPVVEKALRQLAQYREGI
jgi:uncharacterized protein YdiU (UPF0061 family)